MTSHVRPSVTEVVMVAEREWERGREGERERGREGGGAGERGMKEREGVLVAAEGEGAIRLQDIPFSRAIILFQIWK